MHLDLDREQRARLELIALHVGKQPAQVLIEAASFLLERDVQYWQSLRPAGPPVGCQTFLESDQLDARFAQMLRR
jgi:hypothetical protein